MKMSSTRSNINNIMVFLFFFFFFFHLISSSHVTHDQSSACKSTANPKLCRGILSSFNTSSSSSPYNYSKFSIKQCLKQAKRLSKLINHYLIKSRHVDEDEGPLVDCAQLFELNVDYLQGIMTELRSIDSAGDSVSSYNDDDELVSRVEALLSGVVTNQQTCYDGIRESSGGWSVGLASVLHAPVVDGGELYSVALGLVTHALRRARAKTRAGRKRHGSGRVLIGSHRSWEPSIKALEALRDKPRSLFHGGRRALLAEMASHNIVIRETVTVSQNGDGNFTSINDAVSFAPNNSKVEDGYFIIYIKQGYYQEYIKISKHKTGIMLLGDGINQTVISGNRSVFDGWTTFNSATFAVSGERFVGIGITFMNTAGPWRHQAVAVRNNADLSTFYQCSFMGYQDTLYVHSMRQFYRDCDIYGTVDFIFGNSASVFQNCNLYARKPLPNQKNTFTAQGRSDPNQSTGISIHNCTIQAAPELAIDHDYVGGSYLGRPWHNYSRTVFMQSYIGDLIDPLGWLAWNETVGVDTVFYGEFENYGPGANASHRVQWPGYKLMNLTEALNFTVYNFTMGDTWLPFADIPFYAGLF